MPDTRLADTSDCVVAIARTHRASYARFESPGPAPELPSGLASTEAIRTVREVLRLHGLDADRFDTPSWNPLAELIPAGSVVALKPNWVHHRHKADKGLDCLVTHISVIEAALEYVALARPSRVIIGDAPVQSCDFGELRRLTGIDDVANRFRSRGVDITVADFRRTVRTAEGRSENVRGMADFVLFDLAGQSLLEPLRADAHKFRVTMYNPDWMARTHAPGRHQYLIAREVLEAQVVLNLPKLKCHVKAGVTGALKNLVGINGNKEYLPHHRKGGSESGGDCYAGGSWLKKRAEHLLDAANRREPGAFQAALARASERLAQLEEKLGGDSNLEGNWHGNDTVWRMCLDLQRILRYGTPKGALEPRPQRRVLTLTDAIIAGEGEGPLAPDPVPAGFVSFAKNVAAAEWVHARLMGLDPERVPLVREAFGSFAYPLAEFPPSVVRARLENAEVPASRVGPFDRRAFQPPRGWRGHCELELHNDYESRLDPVVA
jgi:uncharacterized protein (DUF362 family)